MFISKVRIKGFRNFQDTKIEFHEGINVIIGHNNAGKSNILHAIRLVLDCQCTRRLGIYDFNRYISLESLKKNAPTISISVTLKKSSIDEQADDLTTVRNWLTKLEDDYEAELTYEFFLPEDKVDAYKESISGADDCKQAWKIIQRNFLRYYVYRIWGGASDKHIVAESDNLQKIDFQFLNAIRDVSKDLFSGRNTLLHEVLDFFIDFDIKKSEKLTSDEKREQIQILQDKFDSDSSELLEKLIERMESGKSEMLDYATAIGASFNGATPDFEGSLSETEMFSALQMIIKYTTGIEISANHNGLGYNNLIYMSLLLAKMQANSDGNYLGSNAKVFSILAIEEPEAHLHPAMQYKFLKFLKDNQIAKKKARQIFVTSHSTQITAAVSLDDIICLYSKHIGDNQVGYPGRVFTDSEEDQDSKAYVQRFLDATKSDMLFAQKVIMVEGIAEELLLPTLAKYSGFDLTDHHIAVINVGGRYFSHFLKLFDMDKSDYAIPKKIVCITDRDPVRKSKTAKNSKFTTCYPFEYEMEMDSYDYKKHGIDEENLYKDNPNIHFFSQDIEKGKTLEYDLMLHNINSDLLYTKSVSNIEEMKKMRSLDLDKAIDALRNGNFKTKMKESLSKSEWEIEDKKKALMASRYLFSVDKGGNALELCVALEKNYVLPAGKKEDFIVPPYIEKALEWLFA